MAAPQLNGAPQVTDEVAMGFQGRVVRYRVAEVTVPEDSPWRPALLILPIMEEHEAPDTWALVAFDINGQFFVKASRGDNVGQWSPVPETADCPLMPHRQGQAPGPRPWQTQQDGSPR